MKKKIMIFTLLLSFIFLFSNSEIVKADEEQEWTNFAEWWFLNGKDINALPFEYDDGCNYMYITNAYTGHIILVWDKDVNPGFYATSGSYSYLKYRSGALTGYYLSTDGGVTWNNVVNNYSDVFYHYAVPNAAYSDVVVTGSSNLAGKIYIGASRTGQYVQWSDAFSKLTQAQKDKLESYQYYIVQSNPVRLNDWKSEQYMILCSNSSNAIIRDEAYNALCFTTGSGKEAGYVLIFDSYSMLWHDYDSSYAYSLGCKEEVGGEQPHFLYSNVDIYYELGISYAKDSEVWRYASPYDSSVTPTPMPTQQEVVTTGFPRLFEVTDALGYVRKYADSDSAILCAFAKGKGGLVTGVEYDNSGDAWYKVDAFVGGERYIGYIWAESVYVGYSAPNVGGGDSGSTVTPTVAPSGGSSGAGRPGSGTRPDTGGQATGGGGLDFIINLFTLIWTKICSIPMAVDGYSISLQQIVIYGALVSIVGGFIMHFIFGRK